jgi:hypothetical protein
MRRFRRRRSRTAELARIIAALDRMAAERRPAGRQRVGRVALRL